MIEAAAASTPTASVPATSPRRTRSSDQSQARVCFGVGNGQGLAHRSTICR